MTTQTGSDVPIDFSGMDLSSTPAAATSYTRAGLRVVPIPYRSKDPHRRGWQKWRLKVEDLPNHFKGEPQNIGVLLGEPSRGLLDADGDSPEAVSLMCELLPPTGAIFGRVGKPGSHRLYQSDGPPPKAVKLTDLDGKTCMIELRSTGQTVFPPSTHEGTGEDIRFEAQGVAARVDPRELSRAIHEIGAASLLARRMNGSGIRHDVALALSGLLLKGGWQVERVEKFIGALFRACGDEEMDDRLKAVQTTAEKMANGESVIGWSLLREKFGDEVAARVRKWLSLPKVSASAKSAGAYRATPEGIVREHETGDGVRVIKLTNFTGAITGEVIEDDGAEQQRHFDLRCELRGRVHEFRLPVGSFSSMNWAIERMGATAIVEPGMGTRDHARAAFQHLSDPDIPRTTVYTHTGWRRIEGVGHVFLHAGGAVGPLGPVESVETRLEGPLALFVLPEPPSGEDLVTAIQASLKLAELGPSHIAVPAFAAIFRAPLGGTDFSMFNVGPTGVFKSEHAALIQQHFGKDMTRTRLPGSWSSSDNAIEDTLFRAKDVVFVVDDFKPSGSSSEDNRLHAKADRIFRGTGNGAGRGRMRADTSLRPPRPPRALPFSTGEDLPRGHSMRARLVVSEIDNGDIDPKSLARCQANASAGLYAQTTSAYVKWVAGGYEKIQEQLRRRTEEIRNELASAHRRTPSNIATLLAALEIFLRFVAETTGEEAITTKEATALLKKWRAAMIEAGKAQQDGQEDADPALRYMDLLRSAITSGAAYLNDDCGERPEDPEAWGWREEQYGINKEWKPRGNLIGWVGDENIYLDPGAAYKVAQSMCGPGDTFPVSETRLRKLMNTRGLLAATEESRSRLTCRISLQGSRRNVLCIRASLLREPAQVSQSSLPPV